MITKLVDLRVIRTDDGKAKIEMNIDGKVIRSRSIDFLPYKSFIKTTSLASRHKEYKRRRSNDDFFVYSFKGIVEEDEKLYYYEAITKNKRFWLRYDLDSITTDIIVVGRPERPNVKILTDNVELSAERSRQSVYLYLNGWDFETFRYPFLDEEPTNAMIAKAKSVDNVFPLMKNGVTVKDEDGYFYLQKSRFFDDLLLKYKDGEVSIELNKNTKEN